MGLVKFMCLLVVAVSASIQSYAQLQANIVGAPRQCRNEIGQLEVDYDVQIRFTNKAQTPVIVKVGTAKALNFFLFAGKETTDPASAIYQSNPDSVEPPPSRTLHLRAREHTDWTTVATVTIVTPGASQRLPKPGHYFLLPVPDLEVVGHPLPDAEIFETKRLLPLTIEEAQSNVPACKR